MTGPELKPRDAIPQTLSIIPIWGSHLNWSGPSLFPDGRRFLECELCISEMRVLSTPLWLWFLTAPSTLQSLVSPPGLNRWAGERDHPSYLKAVSELSPSQRVTWQPGSQTRSLGARPWEVRSEEMRPLDLFLDGDTCPRNKPLLDNKKSSSSKGDANQKPTLCPQAVLG